ncbi:MAG: hypothetical protein ACYS76_09650 [Planctomycetota bacterium]|jgi:hypothetical protein
MKIKNWEQFQHYKNRKPPWIRLYRDLLDDDDFADLPDSAVRHLLMFWLIASEDPTLEGNLPTVKKLAFRLRTTEQKVEKSISQLSHYLECDASNVLDGCGQVATPEAEAEERQRREDTETDARAGDFNQFWSVYPKKVGKLAAERAWKTAKKNKKLPPIETVIEAVERQKASENWHKKNGQYIPGPQRWINEGRWMDEQTKSALDEYMERSAAEAAAEEGDVIDVEFK